MATDPKVLVRRYFGDVLLRVQDGKIMQGWANWDGVALLQQLGVLPAAK